jgi:hypothetical protein
MEGGFLQVRQTKPVSSGLWLTLSSNNDLLSADVYIGHTAPGTSNSVVYCAVLVTPAITARFLEDPFEVFDNSGIKTGKPEYLYLLNSHGIPNINFSGRNCLSAETTNPFI